MPVYDYRDTVINLINEVRLQSKLQPVSSLDEDDDSVLKLGYLNEVVSMISDYDNWQETLVEAIVSIQASVVDYAVSGVIVQGIHEVAHSERTSELRFVTLDTIRRLQRNNTTGTPSQYSIKGVTSEGNPIITIHPRPTSNQEDEHLDILYYEKPPVYTTADASAIVPFDKDLVTQGLKIMTILDESDGEPSQRFQTEYAVFQKSIAETYNRYNGDTASTTYLRPGRGRR